MYVQDQTYMAYTAKTSNFLTYSVFCLYIYSGLLHFLVTTICFVYMNENPIQFKDNINPIPWLVISSSNWVSELICLVWPFILNLLHHLYGILFVPDMAIDIHEYKNLYLQIEYCAWLQPPLLLSKDTRCRLMDGFCSHISSNLKRKLNQRRIKSERCLFCALNIITVHHLELRNQYASALFPELNHGISFSKHSTWQLHWILI